MFAEYALLPCIFDTKHFNNPEIGELHLKNLKEILLHEESLVRDLYNGKWSQFVKNIGSKPYCTKEILKILLKSHRLHRVKAVKAHKPENYIDWCNEALSSHKEDALDGIIASSQTIQNFTTETTETLIASVEKLYKADWWANRSHSVGLERKTSDYLKCLKRLLNYANSITFIDPYFDVVKHEYREFSQILEAINRSDDPPSIEIHICHLNSISTREYEEDFRKHKRFSSVIQSKKLSVEVFIWDKFHDRYIISNLGGIQSGHSFGVSDHPNETTTWTRISRTRRDELQKEFSRNSNSHKLQHHFVL
ncbi:hypothetical protein NG798_22490 [Ancylothrix sp. C2]|uniref:hypothetical protein n=1 Tax=Ancylothrix sp. D3o TaxID=2953691 RepID=UPI0021BBAD50|nr:hypothetical protein [Ancylothrix sp. D3o]MCT7952569.1 hypothetical protein [Ancylothrix sp. D3o]